MKRYSYSILLLFLCFTLYGCSNEQHSLESVNNVQEVETQIETASQEKIQETVMESPFEVLIDKNSLQIKKSKKPLF